MDAQAGPLLTFMRGASQCVVPVFQRPYGWSETQLERLWQDILAAGLDDRKSSHFFGSIIDIKASRDLVFDQSPLVVIDGQQRLTTVLLLIEAIARAAGDDGPTDEISDRKLRAYYLVNELESGEKRYKMLLSQTDKASLKALLDRGPAPREPSHQIEKNFTWFADRIAGERSNLVPLWRGITKLLIVEIRLDRGLDEPQLIYETMNSTGLALTQADLIRNLVLMKLAPMEQTRLYENYWRPMEEEFGQDNAWRFDRFIRHFLAIRTGVLHREHEVYEAFKAYASREGATPVEQLCGDLRSFAICYCRFACNKEKDRELAEAFLDLQQLGSEACHSFLLALYRDYVQKILDRDSFIAAVRLIEAFLFRRAVTWMPSNSLNRFFASLARDVGLGTMDKALYSASIVAALVKDHGAYRFPLNAEVEEAIRDKDAYNKGHTRFWLRRMENHGRRERVSIEDYTIEHIMPQNPELRPEWREALGPDWRSVQERYLHKIGNLTLTGYNSEYSDRPFAEKRDTKGGFRSSPLRLNEGLRNLKDWNEDTILLRSREIVDRTLSIWPRPRVEDSRAASSVNPSRAGEVTDIFGSTSAIYEALRRDVLAFGSDVAEENVADGRAFSCGAVFATVRPSSDGLLMVLEVDPSTLDDPRERCHPATTVGRPEAAELAVQSPNEVRYAITLVFQAYERQMAAASGGN